MTLCQAVWSVFCHIMALSLFYRWGHKVKWSGQGHTAICCYSVTKLCPILCDPMDCSTPGSPVLYYLPKFAQIYVPWIGDAIQPSHPLSPPSPAFNLSQHQGLFQWVSSLHQVAKVLEPQLQHQSFQRIFKVFIILFKVQKSGNNLFINWWMDKQNGVYSSRGILVSHEKGKYTVI